jgi:hypothetical protein
VPVEGFWGCDAISVLEGLYTMEKERKCCWLSPVERKATLHVSPLPPSSLLTAYDLLPDEEGEALLHIALTPCLHYLCTSLFSSLYEEECIHADSLGKALRIILYLCTVILAQ